MEVLILSGLALIGYELSSNGKTTRRSSEPKSILKPVNKYPIKDDNSPKPFFRSAQVQKSNTYLQELGSKRIEGYTGVGDPTWKHKTEVENPFKPTKDLNHINGAPISLNETNRNDRYTSSFTNKMQSVAPVEKQFVGPGLNAGADTSARGGFHDTFRILPNNVNEYKKNNFGGRIISGKGVTTERDHIPSIQDNEKSQRYYTINDRHVAPGKSQITGQSMRAEHLVSDTNRETDCSFNGNISTLTQGQLSHNGSSTRSHDSTQCNVSGNPHMQVGGAGAYAGSSQYIMKEGERENGSVLTNAHVSNAGRVYYNNQGTNPTQREHVSNHQGPAHNTSVAMGGHLSNSHQVGVTQREQLAENSYIVAGASGNAGTSNRTYQANVTQREQTGANNYGLGGPAASVHKAYTSQNTHRNADAYASRESVQASYTPNGGRMNVLGDPTKVVGSVQLSSDRNNNQEFNHGKGVNQVTNSKQYGHTEFAPKVPVCNPRNDLNIASAQLQNNPYFQSVQ